MVVAIPGKRDPLRDGDLAPNIPCMSGVSMGTGNDLGR